MNWMNNRVNAIIYEFGLSAVCWQRLQSTSLSLR